MKSDFELAKDTAIKAGKLIFKYFNTDYDIENKSYNNPVTTADKEADKFIKSNLLATRKNYGWLSEETKDSPDRLKKKNVWIVDPLDGTKEFINKTGEFTVNIAYIQNGTPTHGVVYAPAIKRLFSTDQNVNPMQALMISQKAVKILEHLINWRMKELTKK